MRAAFEESGYFSVSGDFPLELGILEPRRWTAVNECKLMPYRYIWLDTGSRPMLAFRLAARGACLCAAAAYIHRCAILGAP